MRSVCSNCAYYPKKAYFYSNFATSLQCILEIRRRCVRGVEVNPPLKTRSILSARNTFAFFTFLILLIFSLFRFFCTRVAISGRFDKIFANCRSFIIFRPLRVLLEMLSVSRNFFISSSDMNGNFRFGNSR